MPQFNFTATSRICDSTERRRFDVTLCVMPNRADDVGFALINPPFNGATAAVAAAGSVGGYIRRDVTDLNVGRQES
jgi:hypothetical protein